MRPDELKEALLGVMEQKHHWAWPGFTSGLVRRDRLHVHLEQEYATYVRDFPLLVARAYVVCPIPAVRRELIENVYEEETGGISAGRPHPELFLEYPRGLGMDLERFQHVELIAGARQFRAAIDRATIGQPWEGAAAVTTLFLEGTRFDRGELDPRAPKRPQAPLEQHPLVKHYGLPIERLALTRAHRQVEGSHRAAAWRYLLEHGAPAHHGAMLEHMRAVLAAWVTYRDHVASECGLLRAEDGTPYLAEAQDLATRSKPPEA